MFKTLHLFYYIILCFCSKETMRFTEELNALIIEISSLEIPKDK
jgi:hypothetical protein